MTDLFKGVAIIFDCLILTWVNLYGWFYLFGIVGQPSERVLVLFVFLAVLWSGATNLRLRSGYFVPGTEREIA